MLERTWHLWRLCIWALPIKISKWLSLQGRTICKKQFFKSYISYVIAVWRAGNFSTERFMFALNLLSGPLEPGTCFDLWICAMVSQEPLIFLSWRESTQMQVSSCRRNSTESNLQTSPWDTRCFPKCISIPGTLTILKSRLTVNLIIVSS